MNRAES